VYWRWSSNKENKTKSYFTTTPPPHTRSLALFFNSRRSDLAWPIKLSQNNVIAIANKITRERCGVLVFIFPLCNCRLLTGKFRYTFYRDTRGSTKPDPFFLLDIRKKGVLMPDNFELAKMPLILLPPALLHPGNPWSTLYLRQGNKGKPPPSGSYDQGVTGRYPDGIAPSVPVNRRFFVKKKKSDSPACLLIKRRGRSKAWGPSSTKRRGIPGSRSVPAR